MLDGSCCDIVHGARLMAKGAGRPWGPGAGPLAWARAMSPKAKYLKKLRSKILLVVSLKPR